MSRFPDGFRVRLRADVRRLPTPGGMLLVGGSPLRAMRLASAAWDRVRHDELAVTDPLSDALAGRLVDGNLADPVTDESHLDPGELTVVVPVRDRPEQLARCLAGLRGLTTLVVDDASRDPEAVRLAATSAGASVIALPDNLGPAGARNAGLAEVTTPYVAFVDSDVVADAATLTALAAHLRDRAVALVGPLVRSRPRGESDGGRVHWFERFDAEVSSLALGRRACSVRPGAAVGWLPSACLVGRTATLRAAGGFTARMRVGEDVDLVWRLVAEGHRVRYDPDLVAHHDTRTTVRGWLGRKFVYGSGGAELAARHGRNGAPAVMTLSYAATAAAILLARRWSPLAGAAGLAFGWWRLDRRLPATGLPDGERRILAARLATQGLGWAVRQESALVLRHWWPLTALALAGAGRTRPALLRALAACLVVDAIVSESEHPGAPYALLGRRLDDLAYGAGLWWGAARARSIRCLLPRRPGS
ncbi:MAG: mycofactocin biosynthesis glycosyltransferase MftF [Nocardioides sp.]|uniref:mycofactocin biosynthesis glycosyltransferase MftF n=1 Tax=Nocardioides sp. TaxID=35761 RepID=UPI0039E699CB